jgi:double-stranded RNA-binding protein Staufen
MLVIFQVSKKRAAEKMLDELRKLPPQSPTNIAASMARLKRKANPGKKKTRNLIKVYQQVSYDKTLCKHI